MSPAIVGGGTPAAGGTTYPDILFYWGGESTTTEKPAGTMTAITEAAIATTPAKGAGVAAGMPGSNSGHYPTANDAYRMAIASNDIFLPSSGRAGLYIYYDTLTTVGGAVFKGYYDDNNMFYATTIAGPKLHLVLFAGGTADICNSTTNFAVDTWYYVEFAWNIVGTDPNLQVYVNGVKESDSTGTVGTWAGTNGYLYFGEGNDAGVADLYTDQMLVSNNYARSLYAIRDLTSFPSS